MQHQEIKWERNGKSITNFSDIRDQLFSDEGTATIKQDAAKFLNGDYSLLQSPHGKKYDFLGNLLFERSYTDGFLDGFRRGFVEGSKLMEMEIQKEKK